MFADSADLSYNLHLLSKEARRTVRPTLEEIRWASDHQSHSTWAAKAVSPIDNT
jgi:hypothetical protein